MEDEVIGGVLLVALFVVGYLAFKAWKGFDGVGPGLAQLLKKLWNAVDGVFSKSVDALTSTPGAQFGSGPDSVHTGSNLDPGSIVDYEMPDSQIAEEPLETVPLPSSPVGGLQ